MKKVEVKCDTCKKTFVVKPERKKDSMPINGRVQSIIVDYFICPHCKEEYPVMIRDKLLLKVDGKFVAHEVKHEAELMCLYRKKLTRDRDG